MGWSGNSFVCAFCRRYIFNPPPPSSLGSSEHFRRYSRRGSGWECSITRKIWDGGVKDYVWETISEWEDEIWKEVWDKRKGGVIFRELDPGKSSLPPEVRNSVRATLRQFSGSLMESDVADTGSIGTRLVDRKLLWRDLDLWRVLLAFRKRVYADQGVREVWKGMRIRNVDLPIEGPQADIFWRAFLTTGFRDEEFLGEVWAYVREFEKSGKGEMWEKLYDMLVGHYVAQDTSKALLWHQKLYPKYQPKSWIAFVKTAITKNPHCHKVLQEFHITIKNPGFYAAGIIKLVCSLGMQAEAIKWNRHLHHFLDLPRDSSAADALLAWIAKYQNINQLRDFVKTFIDKDIPIAESSLVEMVKARTNTLEVLGFLFDESMNIAISALGDQFWAALLEQEDITVGDVLMYMAQLRGYLVVGPETLKGIMKYTALDRDAALDILSEIGVKFEDPDPDAINNGKRKHVADISNNRIPDDASMLKLYSKYREYHSFDVLLNSLPRPLSPKVQNVLVQTCIYRGFYEYAAGLLEDMRRNAIPISNKTIILVLRRFLRRRRPGKAPFAPPPGEDDLSYVITLFISFLRSGVKKVEPETWHEIFRRLGMLRRLYELEKLVMELIEWYHPHAPTTIRRNFPTGKDGENIPLYIPRKSKENPLRKLFPPIFIRAVVEWGFLNFCSWRTVQEACPMIPKPLTVRTLELRYQKLLEWLDAQLSTDFTWGVKLARKMMESGVYVDKRSIVSALRVRLKALFGPGISKEKKNRMAAELNDIPMEQIVAIVEAAWGEPLFERKGWKNEDRYGEDGKEKKGWREAMKLEVLGQRKTGMVKRVWIRGGWYSVPLEDWEPKFARVRKV